MPVQRRSAWSAPVPVRWAAAWLLALLLGACQSAEPVLIGFVAGTSGRVADMGISGRDAVMLAVEACNRSGGIHGRPVRLVIRDDQHDPAVARQVARELIERRVAVVVGPMTSAMADAMVPIFNEARLVCVSPTVTSQAFSGQDDFFFRVHTTTWPSAAKSARYQLKERSLRRIAALYATNNSGYSQSWLDHFSEVFSAGGGQVVARIGFVGGQGPTFHELAQQLLAQAPDAVLVIANSMDAALICQQLRRLDPRVRITLADWSATERFLELGGTAVEGVSVVQSFDRGSQAPAYRAFRDAFMRRYHREPGFPGVYAFDAIQVILDALTRQAPGQDLKQTLLAMGPVSGLQGPFQFDRFGDVARANVSISIVQDGRFVFRE